MAAKNNRIVTYTDKDGQVSYITNGGWDQTTFISMDHLMPVSVARRILKSVRNPSQYKILSPEESKMLLVLSE